MKNNCGIWIGFGSIILAVALASWVVWGLHFLSKDSNPPTKVTEVKTEYRYTGERVNDTDGCPTDKVGYVDTEEYQKCSRIAEQKRMPRWREITANVQVELQPRELPDCALVWDLGVVACYDSGKLVMPGVEPNIKQ